MPKKVKKYRLSNYNLTSNRKINGWTLRKKLGSGGNGEVWSCYNDKKEEYAIKFLKSISKKIGKRFIDEVTFMETYSKSLSTVMPIFDMNLPPKIGFHKSPIPFYFVMPMAESMEESLKVSSLAEKIEMIQQLLSILVSFHSHGISHRDIKPANILRYNNQYVFSDFGLVFFDNKTCKTLTGESIGAKWTISPQMRRDPGQADKFKADVYSMAKTIWMILTGDMKAFDGQYVLKSSMSLDKYLSVKEVYLYPLEKLLFRATDNIEDIRPTALELEQGFSDWININNSWRLKNLIQWQEVQEDIFPKLVPNHAVWYDIRDIINVLRLICRYDNLNCTFFPDGGGMNLTDISISYEKGCIEMRYQDVIHIVKPKRLCFEHISDNIEWNYFSLELDYLTPISEEYQGDDYSEKLYEVAPLNYKSLDEVANMSAMELSKLKPRILTRYIHGSFVMFHKDSIFNNNFSQYKGEHETLGLNFFKLIINRLANKYRDCSMFSLD